MVHASPLGEEATVPPQMSMAPVPKLSKWGFSLILLATCLLPLAALTAYAVWFGRAADVPLPVIVGIGREPVEAVGGRGAVLADVITVENRSSDELPNMTININGQYFLYRQSPLRVGERLVLPQSIFMTKSNQPWVPGRYPITEVNVTGKLPSGRRGIRVQTFGPD